ncbi:NAD(P)H-quinone oxidoreductase [Paenibacillus sp. MER TA 81-3]|uniref:NAD(P)H-quinone oxidoreductase n=1 Tax=Paenibacillus sp. MER TA 81-3 TaxID=2939573 RepID=UPI00203F1FFC|nr:NAD(P)H-quinone oxidoreductase [Paenibacillus sp. MER TA 81-3]MCM3342667.1 NAD(P)H-quinone oxidoreductase [Paenibacillus sp. MER TA 81-3]
MKNDEHAEMIACRVGEEQKLYWGLWNKPALKSGELLVRIYATALNRADLLQKRGKYPVPAGASPILGLEMSGTIEAIGEGVTGWNIGDRVCALLPGGGYAQYAVIPSNMAMRVPDNMTLEQAAAVPEAYLTAFLNVFQLGRLQAGESVLIHAGASGVGTAAIQLAHAAGARVAATAGSEEKCGVIKQLGAELAVNYRKEPLAESVLQWTGQAGVQLVLDSVLAPYWKDHLQCMAMDGRLVLIGTLGGSKVEVDFMSVMLHRLQIIGSTLRGLPLERKARLTADFVSFAMPRFEAGQCMPVVDSVWQPDQINEAHERMERNENVGKLVLIVP